MREEEKLRQIFNHKKKEKETSKVSEEDFDQNHEQIKQEIEQLKAQAQNEATQIVEQAKQEAEQIRAQSEEEVQKMMETGYQEGYNQGLKEGQQAGGQQVLSTIEEQLQNLQSEVERARMKIDDKIEGMSNHVIRLSTKIAEKIIKRQIELNPELIIEQVESILTGLGRIKSLTVRVNPAQLDILKVKEDDFLHLTQGIDDIEFVIDHSLQPGGCIIETDTGGADASIETQLESITNILLEGNRDKNA